MEIILISQNKCSDFKCINNIKKRRISSILTSFFVIRSYVEIVLNISVEYLMPSNGLKINHSSIDICLWFSKWSREIETTSVYAIQYVTKIISLYTKSSLINREFLKRQMSKYFKKKICSWQKNWETLFFTITSFLFRNMQIPYLQKKVILCKIIGCPKVEINLIFKFMGRS